MRASFAQSDLISRERSLKANGDASMVTKEKIVKCAESIVTGMSLKRGEAVVIRGGTHTQELDRKSVV